MHPGTIILIHAAGFHTRRREVGIVHKVSSLIYFIQNDVLFSFFLMFTSDVIKQLLKNILYQTILFSIPVWLKSDSCKLTLGESFIHVPSERKWILENF